MKIANVLVSILENSKATPSNKKRVTTKMVVTLEFVGSGERI